MEQKGEGIEEEGANRIGLGGFGVSSKKKRELQFSYSSRPMRYMYGILRTLHADWGSSNVWLNQTPQQPGKPANLAGWARKLGLGLSPGCMWNCGWYVSLCARVSLFRGRGGV